MWDEVLQRLAILKAHDFRFSTLGANYHRYVLNPPVPPEKVAEMENKLWVTFPPELRTLYLEVANIGSISKRAFMISIGFDRSAIAAMDDSSSTGRTPTKVPLPTWRHKFVVLFQNR